MWNPIRRKQRPAAAPSPGTVAALAGASIPTADWASDDAPTIRLDCPNCSSSAPKPPLLAVTWKIPDHPTRTTRVLRCPDCTCQFYDDQNPPDYGDEALLERGRLPFYIQQNAGLTLITLPLARVRKPAGSTYLEVGCGFGFGVDFAQRARGWIGSGIDPAPMAAIGGRLLGVTIELRYLEPQDAARAQCDVILSSETIEHVPSPAAFVAVLRAALRPGGVLMLTTPDGDALTPALSSGTLMQMLSPGLHLVFQNRRSLSRLLADAGFAHVEIDSDAFTLIAYASDAPLDLERDPAVCRRRYRDYLERRSAEVPTDGDLFLGFTGRALLEAVNDADFAAARTLWSRWDAVCRNRFGLALDSLGHLPSGTTHCSLADMVRLMPLNLGSVLYARAMLRLSEGVGRPALEKQFATAAAAARTLRRALADLALDDGMAEAIEWTGTAEALLCAAEGGKADVAPRLRALGPAPNGAGGAARRVELGERVLVHLVNGGRFAQARTVADAEGLRGVPLGAADPTPGRRSHLDALYCLAVLDLQVGGNVERARRTLARLLASLTGTGRVAPQDRSLYWSALRAATRACEMTKQPDRAEALRHEALAVGAGGDLSLIPADLRPTANSVEQMQQPVHGR